MLHFTNRLKKSPLIIYQHIRPYIAATYANTKQISARIRHKKDTIHLQVLTSHKLGPKLCSDISLREYVLGANWHTLLKIENKKQRFSYEEESFEQDKTDSLSPENIIFPENIFGVPQTVWDSFIAHLDHQEIVDLLNLKQHRHLWPAYQYALSAPTVQLVNARAQLIGKFHFLLSIALYNSEYPQDVEREFYFPILKTIKHDLDHGEFSKTNMETLHHCLTLSVINKLRHCSNILDLRVMAMMVFSYAKTALEPLDRERKLGAINMLPSSNKDPAHFASALKLAKTAQVISARPGLLFFNSRSQWASYSDEANQTNILGKHYFDALFHDLIHRQVLLQAHVLNVFVDRDLLHFVKERFESLFLEDTTMNKIKALQTYWQHNSYRISAIKPVQHQERFWSPLISNTVINGITIRPLASVDSVVQHGKLMQHCVQTDVFVECCRTLNADILELMSEDGEISTLDIRSSHNGYYKLQHVGVYGNKPPSKSHLEAGIKLLEEIQSGNIKLSKARQIKNANPPYQFDYALNDIATQESIYQTYKYTKMLPPRLIYADYAEMLAQTNLATIIDEVFKKISEDNMTSVQSLNKY